MLCSHRKEDLLCTHKSHTGIISYNEIPKICPFKGGVAQAMVRAHLVYKLCLKNLLLAIRLLPIAVFISVLRLELTSVLQLETFAYPRL